MQTGHVQVSLQLPASFDMLRVLQVPSVLDDGCLTFGSGVYHLGVKLTEFPNYQKLFHQIWTQLVF